MESIKLGLESIYFGKLGFDSDLIDEVRGFAAERGVKSGFFTVIGAVKKAVLGFYKQDAKKYVEEEFDEPLEIASCMGNVFMKDGKLFVHAHASFSREDGSAIGGHLVSAKIFAGELFFFGFEKGINRKFDPETGLFLADI